MKKFAIATGAAGALAAAALGMAGAAAAAPSGPSSVADTVASLQANGYKVIVTRLSGGESSKCSVCRAPSRPADHSASSHRGRRHGPAGRLQAPSYVDVRC